MGGIIEYDKCESIPPSSLCEHNRAAKVIVLDVLVAQGGGPSHGAARNLHAQSFPANVVRM